MFAASFQTGITFIIAHSPARFKEFCPAAPKILTGILADHTKPGPCSSRGPANAAILCRGGVRPPG